MEDKLRNALMGGVSQAPAQRPRPRDHQIWIDEALRIDDAAARRLRDSFRTHFPPKQPSPPRAPAVEDFQTADLVMEMLKRGYAVIKMPEDGSLPETLK